MISVLTVNHHSSADVRALAASIRDHLDGFRVELIVTNNSPADPLDLPSDDRCSSHVVVPDGNVGYAAGVNLAGKRSRGDVLMIANPDVRVSAEAFRGAVAFLDANPDVGIVLPLLRFPDGHVQASIRRFYTWPVVLFARSPLRRLAHHPRFFRRYLCTDVDRSRPTVADWGLGAAMFLRRVDWPEGQLFDERFFMYFEDVDLCYRTWQRSQRVMYCPHIVCEHLHRRASVNPFSLAGWRHFRSLVRFVMKYRGLPQRPAVDGHASNAS